MAHTVVYRVAMHYLTDNEQSIVEQIIRSEKKAIKDYSEQFSLENPWESKSSATDSSTALSEVPFEKVVVKVCRGIVSVYPVIETDWQIFNETWVKHDTRKGSQAQKHGSLFIGQNESLLHFEVWKHGDYKNICDINPEKEDVLNQVTLEQYATEEFLFEWKNCCSSIENDFADVPLFLPTDWQTKWKPFRLTQLTTFC